MPRPKLILEIGHERNPVPERMLLNNRQLPRDALYLGVDNARTGFKGSSRLAPAIRKLEGEYLEWYAKGAQLARSKLGEYREEHDNQRIFFAEADGKHLPLPDGTIHEVHLHNVLNEPLNIRSNGGRTLERILSEAHRVLTPGGRLVMLNSYSVRDEVSLATKAGFNTPRGSAAAAARRKTGSELDWLGTSHLFIFVKPARRKK
ncbi:MAG: methyltransferase domain-containing protein [Candidatus Micrarchaeota archaeon]